MNDSRETTCGLKMRHTSHFVSWTALSRNLVKLAVFSQSGYSDVELPAAVRTDDCMMSRQGQLQLREAVDQGHPHDNNSRTFG